MSVQTSKHPWVDIGFNGRPLYPQYYLGWTIVGMIAAASAFPVYYNSAVHLPISVSFFWFSLFATLGLFFYPNDLTSAVFLRSIDLKKRWVLLYPAAPWIDWINSLKQGGLPLLLLASLTNVLYFVCLLSSLKVKQTGVVVTVLVLQQLSPIFMSLIGLIFLGDTCKRWLGYILGVLVTGGGTILYKDELRQALQTTFFDKVMFLVIAVIVINCANVISATRYRRHYRIEVLNAARSVHFCSAVIGFFWVFFNGASLTLKFDEFLGLLYLGFVPTAFTAIVIDRARDRIGIPITASISSLRPFLLLAVGLVPHPWFHIETAYLTVFHYLGIALGVIGLIIVIWVAEPQPISAKK